MPHLPRTAAVLAALCLTASVATAQPVTRPSPPPPVFTWVPEHLAASRDRVLAGDPALAPAVRRLRADADRWLAKPPDVVTDKPPGYLAPSGDPHDYTSVSVYAWPDPADPKAPWTLIDGQRNTDAVDKFDSPRLSRMCQRVVQCGLAYYFTDDPRYADAAARQLRAWFITPATRMNPHMDYAQCVPNRSKGSPWGIIDFNQLPELLNAAVLLRGSPAWTPDDEAALATWMREFAHWLWTSDLGTAERRAQNNHGTFYDASLITASLYAGDTDRAREVLAAVATDRYARQIEPDGSTPHEQKRPNANMYTCWNLKGLADLALLARRVPGAPDLFAFSTPDGRSLTKAAEWLEPYVLDPATWPYGDKTFQRSNPLAFYWILASATADPRATALLHTHLLPPSDREKWQENRNLLLFPLPPAPEPAP